MRNSSRQLERGSATMLLVTLGTMSLLTLGLGLGLQLGRLDARLQGVADSAALASVDTIAGIIAGYPCANAREIAEKNGADLISCRIVSSVARVSVGKEHQVISITKEASAAMASE